MTITLSVLDQSPISVGMTSEEALANTVRFAQFVDGLGFHRFWVSEHHDTGRLAGSSPEVLISHIAAKTTNLRVGSGGVMLPHYSPYKVAEQFKVLEGLTPGRIDLGLGRAPGGMPLATRALQEGKDTFQSHYPEQIDDLMGYLNNGLEKGHRFEGLQATPKLQTAPEVWLLGTSSSSALLAAEKGLPYAFATFINGQDGVAYSKYYRENFRPSPYLEKPVNIFAIQVICAETEQEAERLARCLDVILLMLERGIRSKGIPSPEEAASLSFNAFDTQRIAENRKRMIVGDPKQVKEQIMRLCEKYEATEIMLVTTMYSFKDKLKSIELVASEFQKG